MVLDQAYYIEHVFFAICLTCITVSFFIYLKRNNKLNSKNNESKKSALQNARKKQKKNQLTVTTVLMNTLIVKLVILWIMMIDPRGFYHILPEFVIPSLSGILAWIMCVDLTYYHFFALYEMLQKFKNIFTSDINLLPEKSQPTPNRTTNANVLTVQNNNKNNKNDAIGNEAAAIGPSSEGSLAVSSSEASSLHESIIENKKLVESKRLIMLSILNKCRTGAVISLVLAAPSYILRCMVFY